MTYAKRYYADFNDILAVRLTCTGCKTVIALPVARIEHSFPEKCPKCRADLWAKGTKDSDELVKLVYAIDCLKNRAKTAPCQIQFEFESPE